MMKKVAAARVLGVGSCAQAEENKKAL